MEVGIRKGAWRRAWRYPAYLWSLRWVSLSKKPGGWYTPYTRVYPPIHHCVQQTMNSKKGKGSPYSIAERIGFRSWSRFLAVCLQVTWVINPAVGCHYFPPGQQLPSQPLRGLLPISLLGEQRHDGTGVNSLPKTVTRQRRDCDLNPGPSAPESST